MNALPYSASPSDEAWVKKSRCENRWTASEDKILFAQVLKGDSPQPYSRIVTDLFEADGRSVCWRSVAAALPGRNNKSCRKRCLPSLLRILLSLNLDPHSRWIHSLNPGLRKGTQGPDAVHTTSSDHNNLSQADGTLPRTLPSQLRLRFTENTGSRSPAC